MYSEQPHPSTGPLLKNLHINELTSCMGARQVHVHVDVKPGSKHQKSSTHVHFKKITLK